MLLIPSFRLQFLGMIPTIGGMVVAGIGCGSGGAGGESVHDYIAQTYTLYCKKAKTCCNAAAWDEIQDVLDCGYSGSFPYTDAEAGAIQDDIDAGHVEFDGQAASRCHARLEQASCAEYFAPYVYECPEAFTPHGKKGSPCLRDQACIEGACTNLACIGPGKAAGEPCASFDDCLSGSCNDGLCQQDYLQLACDGTNAGK